MQWHRFVQEEEMMFTELTRPDAGSKIDLPPTVDHNGDTPEGGCEYSAPISSGLSRRVQDRDANPHVTKKNNSHAMEETHFVEWSQNNLFSKT